MRDPHSGVRPAKALWHKERPSYGRGRPIGTAGGSGCGGAQRRRLDGDWTDPERGKIPVGEYGAVWIKERPNLRPKTPELYRWLFARYVIPDLGGVQIGKLSTQMIRTWRAGLLESGVSVSTTAKAYRLLRAVLMTAVEEDKLLSRNPCRIRGADNEHTAERPVLTLAQVFELADLVGRHPTGNVRKLGAGAFQLRYRELDGEARVSPLAYPTRLAAEDALWMLVAKDQVLIEHDGRYRALALLATFASLRWGEATALRRSDLDLDACTVRVREQLIELDDGEWCSPRPSLARASGWSASRR